MEIYSLLFLLIPLALAYHCYNTGRSLWWLVVLFFFPLLGCLAYVLVEMLSGMGKGGAVVKRRGPAAGSRAEIRQLEKQLKFTDTVEVRKKLAQAYLDGGRYEQAYAAFKQSCTGLYAKDPYLLSGLAQAAFGIEAYGETIHSIDQLRQENPDFKDQATDIIYARALEEQNRLDLALKAYAEVAHYADGEEARCRYALLLKQQGEVNQAQEIFQQIVDKAEHAPRYYRQRQAEWIAKARREC